MEVRVFSEHRCEAAAPTEPAGETQRPRSPTIVARRKCPWGTAKSPDCNPSARGELMNYGGCIFKLLIDWQFCVSVGGLVRYNNCESWVAREDRTYESAAIGAISFMWAYSRCYAHLLLYLHSFLFVRVMFMPLLICSFFLLLPPEQRPQNADAAKRKEPQEEGLWPLLLRFLSFEITPP